MRILRFQIRLPSGQVDQINVESERVLIGSGAHCEIRLPLDQANVEHALIELGPAGVFAKALSFEPAPTINNIPFTQSPLPPESVLGVNQVQIYVMVADAAGIVGGQIQQQKKKTSPIMLMAIGMMLIAGGYLVFVDDQAEDSKSTQRVAPELWDPPAAQCSQSGTQAIALARERIAVADAKRERRPFHVQDGVQAVPVFEQAAACFRAGGDPQSAAAADEAAKILRKEMNDEYRTQRVRLDHSLSIEDYPSAQKEVRVLLQFTEGKTGDYVSWLSNLDRKLKLKLGRQSPR